MFKRACSAVRSAIGSTAGRVSAGASALVASGVSHAEGTDLSAAAVAALKGAEAQVGTTGAAVIGCVVGVVIVGIIVCCIRKA